MGSPSKKSALCRRWQGAAWRGGRLVCRLDGLAGPQKVKGKAGRGLLCGMQGCSAGCSKQQDGGAAAAGGYARVTSPRTDLRAAVSSGGCSNPLLELTASRQRESFPWKKIFSEGSQKEIPEQSCQDPHPPERCSYALLSKPESSWLAAPRARQRELRRERLRGRWMNSALGGRMSGGRALQPPTSSPALKHHLGALSLPSSRWFRITLHSDRVRHSVQLSPGDEM